MKVILAATMLSSASAFVPGFAGARVATRAASSSAMTMAAKDMVGASLPLGFFDPMGFSKGSPEALNSYRESELKHGRAAMLGVLGCLWAEVSHPLYPAYSTNPLTAATQLDISAWAQIVGFCGFIEFVSAKIKARPGYVPGDYLGASELMDQSDESWVTYQTKELNNGRLAMLGIMGIIAGSAVDGKGPIEQLIS